MALASTMPGPQPNAVSEASSAAHVIVISRFPFVLRGDAGVAASRDPTGLPAVSQQGFSSLLRAQEAMRVRPVASTGVTRYAKRDMRLGGHYIPKGSTLLVPFDAVHHFHGNWADADAFVPVRAACLPRLPPERCWCLTFRCVPILPHLTCRSTSTATGPTRTPSCRCALPPSRLPPRAGWCVTFCCC